RDRFRCRTAGVMLEDARTRDIFAANLSTRDKPTLGAGRPRGGVVTQRTANPRTPVRFRPWPPDFPRKISANCGKGRDGRATRDCRLGTKVGAVVCLTCNGCVHYPGRYNS